MTEILIPILLALAICFIPRVKFLAQMFGTITHELGHAVVVMPFGGSLEGIKLRLNTSGEATVSLPRYPFPFYHLLRIVNLFAGYGAPLYLSLLLYVSITRNWDIGLNIIFGFMSIVILFFIRNWFGLLVSITFTAINLAFIFLLPEFMNEYALTVAVILFIRGFTDIYNAARWTFGSKLDNSDFIIASQELHGSPRLWFVLFSIFHSVLLTVLVWVVIQNPVTG